jgi:hypothetical protein
MTRTNKLISRLGFLAITCVAVANLSTTLLADAIPLQTTGILNLTAQASLVAVTTVTPCISFAGSPTCTANNTLTQVDVGSGPLATDTVYKTGASQATIKDIPSTPVAAFIIANTNPSGSATFDLNFIVTPSGLGACSFGMTLGACSTGTFVFTQTDPNTVDINFTVDENAYVTGTSSAAFTHYTSKFSTAFAPQGALIPGCVNQEGAAGNNCTLTIGHILLFEAPAIATFVENGVTVHGEAGTISANWSAQQTALGNTPEPVSYLLFGSGLIALSIFGRRRSRS